MRIGMRVTSRQLKTFMRKFNHEYGVMSHASTSSDLRSRSDDLADPPCSTRRYHHRLVRGKSLDILLLSWASLHSWLYISLF